MPLLMHGTGCKRTTMQQDTRDLENASYKALVRRDYTEQAELALQALNLNPSSDPAAVLYFFATWDDSKRDAASTFILDYAKKMGAGGHVQACLILAMLHKGAPSNKVIGHTYLWLDNLPPDDVRKAYIGNSGANIKSLNTAFLDTVSIETGPKISDQFGSMQTTKTMSSQALKRRWTLPSYHVARNISVNPREWYLFDESNVYLEEVHTWPDKMKELRVFLPATSPSMIMMTDKAAVLSLPNKQRIIDDPCILLGSDPNYYFMLTHHLGRLKLIDDIFDIRNTPILVGEDLPETHRDCMHHLGIKDENIIECAPDVALYCKEVIIPTSLYCVDSLHPAGVHWLRESFGPKTRDTSLPSRLFVSRSKPHRRRFKNEDVVFKQLEKLGFVKVVPDSLNAEEQNALFQNADIIIGPFGTCLTTSIFAPETCTIFEIIDKPSIPVHRFMENIAIQIGHKFEYVVTGAVERNTKTNSSAEYEFEVDADSLITQLQPYL